MVFLAAALSIVAGCRGHRTAASGAEVVGKTPPPDGGTVAPKPAPKATGTWAHAVASLADKAVGPFFARSELGGMLAYVAWEANVARLFVAPVSTSGAPQHEPRPVASVGAETSLLVLRPAPAAFVAAWVQLTDRGSLLSLVSVGADGSPRATPVEAARTEDHIVWVDVVPTPAGAVCVWAEETRTGDANVLSLALDREGKPRGVPVRVARGVSAWQAVRTPQRLGLALVSFGAKGAGGTLAWTTLDADGRPLGTVPVVSAPRVGRDLDAVATPGGGALFAWTERTRTEPELVLASVDSAGAVLGPTAVLDDLGGSSLLALAATKRDVVLAWEERRAPAHPAAELRLGRIDLATLRPKDALGVRYQPKAHPELVATRDGIALLVRANVCESAGTPCVSAPAFVRFDEALRPSGGEPLLFGEALEPPALAWGLDCAGDPCLALTAHGSPAAVALADLSVRPTAYRAPIVEPLPLEAPRLDSLRTLVAADAMLDVATTRVGRSVLVAFLASRTAATKPSDAKPTPKKPAGSKKPEGARKGKEAMAAELAEVPLDLAVTVVDDLGRAKATSFVTNRALASGGVAIAAGAGGDDGAAIAWVGRDGGDDQVHVTRVDRDGKRSYEIQLTTEKGSARDVTIGWSGGGWVVGWVDGRDGNGEVYATKLSPELKRVAREERLSRAAGDASDLAIFADPSAVWFAWSDPRESPDEGFGDVHVMSVRSRDVKPATPDVRVMATAAHSRSPVLVRDGKGELVVAWIEETPAGADASTTSGYGAFVAWLDERGRPVGEPRRLTGAGGAPSAIFLASDAAGVRAFVARALRDELVVDTARIPPEGAIGALYPLFRLDAPPSFDVALSYEGGALFYIDDGPLQGDARVRRATYRVPK